MTESGRDSGSDGSRSEAELYRQAGALFEEARRLAPAEQPAFVARRAEGDPRLAAEVLRLLESAEGPDLGRAVREAIARQAASLADDPSSRETRRSDADGLPRRLEAGSHPDRIGAFRIVDVLGEGGMGIVYSAVQVEPVRRRVALKVIKLGMDSRQVLARFEAERQALAVMEHPGIARALDAGTTETGRPWFAMELVQGVPLTDYCDQARLNTRERLELFRQVCHAVQHAHQKGIVHRDLKPSNVLVAEHEGRALPKVIDFGIAKALGHSLTDKTLVTRIGDVMGTPAYMSPEQSAGSGLDVDTRTDVYALGVLLYELLTGHLPHESAGSAEKYLSNLASGRVEPPTPSSRLSTLDGGRAEDLARRRRTTATALQGELQGDLDWITRKAIEGDRSRRYATVSDLEADLRRFLVDEPVEARAPTTGYLLRKFVRRHRVGVSAGAVLAGLLVAFSVVVGLQSIRLAERNAVAEREAENARQIAAFLVELLELSDVSQVAPEKVTARELVERGSERIEARLQQQPLVRAELLAVLSRVLGGLASTDRAVALAEESLAIRRRELGDGHLEVADGLDVLALAHLRSRDAARELPLREEALAIRQRLLGADHEEVGRSLSSLAVVLGNLGEHERAGPLHDRALAVVEAAVGPVHALVAELLNSQALTHCLPLGEHERAAALLERALAISEKASGPDSVETANLMTSLSIVHGDRGDPAAARGWLIRALAIQEKNLGPDHPSLVPNHLNLAYQLTALKDREGAIDQYRRAARVAEEGIGRDSDWARRANGGLVGFFLETGDFASALQTAERFLQGNEAAFGPRHRSVGEGLGLLGRAQLEAGDPESARTSLLRALSIHEDTHGPQESVPPPGGKHAPAAVEPAAPRGRSGGRPPHAEARDAHPGPGPATRILAARWAPGGARPAGGARGALGRGPPTQRERSRDPPTGQGPAAASGPRPGRTR